MSWIWNGSILRCYIIYLQWVQNARIYWTMMSNLGRTRDCALDNENVKLGPMCRLWQCKRNQLNSHHFGRIPCQHYRGSGRSHFIQYNFCGEISGDCSEVHKVCLRPVYLGHAKSEWVLVASAWVPRMGAHVYILPCGLCYETSTFTGQKGWYELDARCAMMKPHPPISQFTCWWKVKIK